MDTRNPACVTTNNQMTGQHVSIMEHSGQATAVSSITGDNMPLRIAWPDHYGPHKWVLISGCESS